MKSSWNKIKQRHSEAMEAGRLPTEPLQQACLKGLLSPCMLQRIYAFIWEIAFQLRAQQTPGGGKLHIFDEQKEG